MRGDENNKKPTLGIRTDQVATGSELPKVPRSPGRKHLSTQPTQTEGSDTIRMLPDPDTSGNELLPEQRAPQPFLASPRSAARRLPQSSPDTVVVPLASDLNMELPKKTPQPAKRRPALPPQLVATDRTSLQPPQSPTALLLSATRPPLPNTALASSSHFSFSDPSVETVVHITGSISPQKASSVTQQPSGDRSLG